MVSWIIFIRLAKWTFFGFLTTGVVFTIRHVAITRYEKEETLPLRTSERLMQKYLGNRLDPDFVQCIQSPSKVFCAAVSREIHLMRTSKFSSTSNYTAQKRRHPVYVTLSGFLHVVTKFNITIILVEPSMLYCMLAIGEKISLGFQGFSIFRHLGTKNIINFVIYQNDSVILESISTLSALRSAGFRRRLIKAKSTELPSGMSSMQTIHYFFEKRMLFIHIIVVFVYDHYFFHAGLPDIFPEKYNFINNVQRSELFGIADSAYKSLQVTLLENNSIIPEGLYIPSSIYQFLLETEFASLIKCEKSNDTTAYWTVNSTEKTHFSDLSSAFNTVLNDLKKLFEFLSTKFFIFDSTYSDWYELCDMNPNAKLLTFAVTTDDAKRTDESIITRFKDNQPLKLIHVLGQIEEAREFKFECFGIEIRLWYVYKANDNVWIGNHNISNNNYTRHAFAEFDLCSVIIYNHVVLAPCKLEQLSSEVK